MSRRKLAVFSLVALLLLAGCSSVVDQSVPTTGSGPTSATTQTPPESPDSTGVPTSVTPTTSSAPTTPQPNNPWRTATVVVSIESPGHTSRNYAPLVRNATRYWEQVESVYAAYQVDFSVRPDASDSDLTVRFEPSVSCGIRDDDVEDTLGCAPTLSSSYRTTHETVRIKTGYTNASTVYTLKHEFGHVLGIEHGEAPLEFMRPRYAPTHTPQKDARLKAYPWDTRNLEIYVGEPVGVHQTDFESNTRTVLEYYRTHQEYTAANVSFTLVHNRSEADIALVFVTRDLPCDVEYGSCYGDIYGYDVDSDPYLESYANATIYVRLGSHMDYRRHIGHWMGYVLGADSDSDLPDRYR